MRVQEDASHLMIDTVMGASGCMNVRACLAPAMFRWCRRAFGCLGAGVGEEGIILAWCLT